MSRAEYQEFVDFVQQCYDIYGDSPQGVGWTKPAEVDARYRVLTDIVAHSGGKPVSILDFGCGLGHMRAFMANHGIVLSEYIGIDMSPRFISICKERFPDDRWVCADILRDEGDSLVFSADYVIISGLFTYKGSSTQEAMIEYWQALIRRIWPAARIGLSFNAMSKIVDWERADLFHLPFDTAAEFIGRQISRHFVFRHDYRLYEYTTYIYR